MRFDLDNLPNDTALLHRLVRDMAAVIETDRTQLSEAQSEVEKLRAIVNQLQRSQFGRRSEKLDPDQLELATEDLDGDIARAEEATPPCPETKPEKPRAKQPRAPPSHLPREDAVLDTGTGACPCCGGALHQIGEGTSEMLDWVPAKLRVIRIRRPKYACRSCEKVQQAAAPERAIAKGMAS